MKMRQLTIRAFRGIPGELSLYFHGSSSCVPNSMLIFGDNGTGKSSIVDAIEFALQARIRRSKRLQFQHYASPISFAVNSHPFIKVIMDNNAIIERSLVAYGNEITESDPAPLPNFSFAPIVLRRTDILRFYETPEAERQLIFHDFFQTPGEGWNTLHREDVVAQNTRRLTLRKERNNLRNKISAYLGLDNKPLPMSFDNILRLVYEKTYGDVIDEDWEGYRLEDLKGYIDEVIYQDLDNLRFTISSYKKAQNEFNNLKVLPTQKTARAEIPKFLGRIGENISVAFKTITKNSFVDRIEVNLGRLSDASLSLMVHLENGRICEPQHIFSEANLDLLAFIVYMSILKESAARGQGKIFVLDDVFQSVDSTIRSATLEYMVGSMKDWQFVITLHDRLWLAQVGAILRRHSIPFIEHHVVRWRFDSGPVFLESVRNSEASLVDAIRLGDVVAICSHAGLLLEEISNRMSWTLPISVIRRKDDKYTLGDLWPGVLKSLKKTDLGATVLEVDRHIQLRNLVGAHYNEWARNLSGQESEEFGSAVLGLLSRLRCERCFAWIESSNNSMMWSCHCGCTVLKSLKAT